jgi:hypothetical protein
LRQFSKKFFEDFYTKAEEAGRFPSPLQAAAAFGRILKRATEEGWQSICFARRDDIHLQPFRDGFHFDLDLNFATERAQG